MSTSRTRAAALLALLLTATACAGSSDPEPTAHSADVPPLATAEAREIRLPLDSYTLTLADNYAIEDAQDVLMRACMRKKDVTWETLPRVPSTEIEPENRYRYGTVEMEIARRYGYHHVPDRPAAARRERVWEARDQLSAKTGDAAYGSDGKGGCLRTTDRQLGDGTPSFSYEVINRLTGQSSEQAARDPEVRKAMSAWSACMREKGYDYPDALSINNDPKWGQTEEPSKAEIEVAVTDVECKRSAKLVPVWFAAETRIQRTLIRKNAGDLQKTKARRDHWLAASRQVLKGD